MASPARHTVCPGSAITCFSSGNALRQEAAIGQVDGDRFGWASTATRSSGVELSGRTERVKPGRRARRGVPDQARRRMDESQADKDQHGEIRRHDVAEAGHSMTLLRLRPGGVLIARVGARLMAGGETVVEVAPVFRRRHRRDRCPAPRRRRSPAARASTLRPAIDAQQDLAARAHERAASVSVRQARRRARCPCAR